MQIQIIKLGGSSITNKSKEYSVNEEILHQAISEIDTTIQKIIIHGGGSFGHPVAKKYELDKGRQQLDNEVFLSAIALTRIKMQELHQSVIQKAAEFSMYPFSLPMSALSYLDRNGKFQFYSKSLQNILSLGMTPVLYGDIVFSEESGSAILSGDEIINLIIQKLKSPAYEIEQIIFGSDVDGVYEKDPKLYPNAIKFREVSIEKLKNVIQSAKESRNIDVTGGMQGKMKSIQKILESGIKVQVINLTMKGQLRAAIQGLKTNGTTFLV